jgi:hypothetical protein
MGYMVRLGLWGDGTCFDVFQKFLGVIDHATLILLFRFCKMMFDLENFDHKTK